MTGLPGGIELAARARSSQMDWRSLLSLGSSVSAAAQFRWPRWWFATIRRHLRSSVVATSFRSYAVVGQTQQPIDRHRGELA